MSGELQREFVDTNVLVYAFDRSADTKHAVAQELLRRLWQDRTGCVSVQVLQEFYTTVTRKISRPIPGPEALELVHDFTMWTTHAPDAGDVEAAIRLHQALQFSFWDAMVVHSALRLRCSILWSEDLTHGQRMHDLQVLNPFRTE
jgi:predicted nucleic acid-binding protein